MDTYMHGYVGMVPCKPEYQHAWVKNDEAQAENARLQAEVERLIDLNADGQKLYRAEMRRKHTAEYQRNTAWNDAIEAAAQVANDYDHHEMESAIRALRRPTSTENNNA